MIAIIAAIYAELAPYIENIVESRKVMHLGRAFYVGKLYGQDVVCVAGGIGKVNAALCTSAAIDKFGAQQVIFSGVGGGMKPEQHIGDIVVVKNCVYHDFDMSWLEMPKPLFDSDSQLLAAAIAATQSLDVPVYIGTAATGDKFIADDGRAEIVSKYAPESVDMETAGAAQAAYMHDVPFIAIRALSDTDSDRGVGTFEKNCSFAAKHAFMVVSQMLMHDI